MRMMPLFNVMQDKLLAVSKADDKLVNLISDPKAAKTKAAGKSQQDLRGELRRSLTNMVSQTKAAAETGSSLETIALVVCLIVAAIGAILTLSASKRETSLPMTAKRLD